MDIYTIGGGEIVYKVLQAVSLCLNGGSGVLQAMLTIGGISGIFMVYFFLLCGNIEQMLKTWVLPMTVMLHLLFVPQTAVWVHDEVSKFHMKLDHVPYGLAVFSSNISKIGKTVTEIIEQNFSVPDDLTYCKTGMIFGSGILEKAKEFKIINPNFRENMRNFVGQCVKYDIMLSQKYTFDELRSSPDVWTLITGNPSGNRGFFWQPPEGGRAQYVTCAKAVEKFNGIWKQELERVSLDFSKKLFSGRAISHSGLGGGQFKMSPQLAQLLKTELWGNLQSTYQYLGNLAQSSEEILKQNIMVNAIQDSSSENSLSSGNPVSYAEMKSLIQQNYTFETIGRLAAKVLPIMKAVIEALVYACFIFIIPLCMIPNGYKFLLNWAATLIWLQAWAPMYAILNFIMNIAARASTISEIGTAGGITAANIAGISAANAEIKTMAGYLAMSIPFLCIAIVKGVGSFVHLAGQMTGASTQAASSASAESVGGNFSYGNVSLGNMQTGNVSQLQRNFNSSLGVGGHKLDTGNVQTQNDLSGRTTISRAYSSGSTDIASTLGDMSEFKKGYSDSLQQMKVDSENLSRVESNSQIETGKLAEMISRRSACDVAQRCGIGVDRATQILNDAKVLSSGYAGHGYSQGTYAGAGISGGISAGISGSVSGGANAGNSINVGDSSQVSQSEDISDVQRRFNSEIKDIAFSRGNDEITQLARDHVNTLARVEEYRAAKSVSEQAAKSYQENFSSGQNFSVSQRMNLRDSAMGIAVEEQGMTMAEASQLLDSQRAEDQRARNALFREAQSRTNLQPSFQQPNFVKSADVKTSDLKNEYNASLSRNQCNAIDNQMATEKNRLKVKQDTVTKNVDLSMSQNSTAIQNQKQSVESKKEKIQQRISARSEDGAVVAAVKHTVNTLMNKKE
jgi:conjugal transfer mating pair stabilization protein TraG